MTDGVIFETTVKSARMAGRILFFVSSKIQLKFHY